MNCKKSRLKEFFSLLLLLVRTSTSTEYNGNSTEWMNPNFKVEFESKPVYHVNLLNRLHWTEKNERDTSKDALKTWEKVDLHFLEWPGNVTVFEEENPVVKWGRGRAKYIEDPCGKEYNGLEMRAYAYKYVYLTWGPHRLTQTYTPPLTIPKSILPFQTLARLSRNHSHEANNLNAVVAFDIAFVYDTLLLAYSEGVILVSGLEMGWAEMSSTPKRPLIYTLSEGLNETVDNLVLQSCCLKTNFCPYGNVVVAYRGSSSPHVIYISLDAGKSFEKIRHSLPNAGILRTVLSYPELDTLIIFHGNKSTVQRSHLNVLSNNSSRTLVIPGKFSGRLQGKRLGQEMSYILWDKCSVWYSPDSDPSSNMTRSLFYVHRKIGGTRREEILSKRCTFGKNSSLAVGRGGTYAILDKDDVFYLGIDSKTRFSQLIALKVDMTLLLPGTERSVVPYFDMDDKPVLIYPPKFLTLPEKLQKGLGKKYERRLGMRLLPKNVYPSDFINNFYVENARWIAEKHRKLLLKPCETSSIQVNGSLSQRRKFYPVYYSNRLNFTIFFKSKLSLSRQLHFEPKSVLKYLSVQMKLMSIDQVDIIQPWYWIKYSVEITAINASAILKTFRIVFFTKNALRCHYQPRVPVFVKIQDKPVTGPILYEDNDMTKQVYLKSTAGGETEYLKLRPPGEAYGEKFRRNMCPLSKMKK